MAAMPQGHDALIPFAPHMRDNTQHGSVLCASTDEALPIVRAVLWEVVRGCFEALVAEEWLHEL